MTIRRYFYLLTDSLTLTNSLFLIIFNIVVDISKKMNGIASIIQGGEI